MRFDRDDIDALQPLIVAAVRATLAEIEAEHSIGTGRLAFTEAEAAERSGIPRWVLRDARLRGEVRAKRIGRRWMYERGALIEFLRDTRNP